MKELRARLSPDAGRAWDRYLTEQRITATALAEAMGRHMGTGWRPPAVVVKIAVEIDRERGSR